MRALYVDSSALVKVIVEEAHSAAARAALLDAELVASTIALTEVPRALARHLRGSDWPRPWRELADQLRLVDLNRAILLAAAQLEPVSVRSLDAIHLATALRAALAEFVTYDRLLFAAATRAGLVALAPGTNW